MKAPSIAGNLVAGIAVAKGIEWIATSISNYVNSSNIARSAATPSNFQQTWNSLGKSGDEKTDEKALEAKEKLLELAEVGKLTKEVFSKSTIAENFLFLK